MRTTFLAVRIFCFYLNPQPPGLHASPGGCLSPHALRE